MFLSAEGIVAIVTAVCAGIVSIIVAIRVRRLNNKSKDKDKTL